MKKFIIGLLIDAGFPIIVIWAIGALDLFLMILGGLGQGLLYFVLTTPWMMFP